MDGRGQTAKLEIHVSAFARRAVPIVALLASATVAQAQRYRVLVGIAGTRQMSLIEFSPCIPAETSACGGWVTSVIDASTDTSYGTLPSAMHEQVSPSHENVITIQNGGVLVRSLAERGGTSRLVVDKLRSATAVVISGDSRYAFAVLEAKTPGDQSMIRMIHLASKSIIASLGLAERPAGISMVP